MRIFWKSMLTTVLVLLAISCQAESWSVDIGGGYDFWSAGAQANKIGKNKRDRLAMTSNEANLRHIRGKIYSWITHYGSNEDFIIALQRPDRELHVILMGDELKSTNNEWMCDHIADSLLTNDPFFQEVFSREENYWIISHERDSLFGPYTEEEYLNQKKVLGVPEEIELKTTRVKSLWELFKSIWE